MKCFISVTFENLNVTWVEHYMHIFLNVPFFTFKNSILKIVKCELS